MAGGTPNGVPYNKGVIMEIKDLITPNVCKSTVFENSWIWYCDSCQIHGVGTQAEEAEFYAEAHLKWTSYISKNEVDKEHILDGVEVEVEAVIDEEDDGEDLLNYWDVDEDYRDWYEWETTCEGAMFIISEGENKTFDLGEDYTNTEPNKITDIELAIEIKKQLGLE